MDLVVTAAVTPEDRLHRLRRVFTVMRNAGLKFRTVQTQIKTDYVIYGTNGKNECKRQTQKRQHLQKFGKLVVVVERITSFWKTYQEFNVRYAADFKPPNDLTRSTKYFQPNNDVRYAFLFCKKTSCEEALAGRFYWDTDSPIRTETNVLLEKYQSETNLKELMNL